MLRPIYIMKYHENGQVCILALEDICNMLKEEGTNQ